MPFRQFDESSRDYGLCLPTNLKSIVSNYHVPSLDDPDISRHDLAQGTAAYDRAWEVRQISPEKMDPVLLTPQEH